MSKSDWAQVIALVAIAIIVVALRTLGRRVWVTIRPQTYDVQAAGATTRRTLEAGAVIPPGDVSKIPEGRRRRVRRSAFSMIVVGADHRTSTSKTVVFAWTLAIAFGLIALIVAKFMGASAGWDEQVRMGLQEEYLLLLGGPFAAAVLAKYAAVAQADEGMRTPAAPGTANTGQLVADDAGDTELGDFQYVLFNVIGLVYFFGAFVGHLADGFPDLPPILTGLVLTSTAGYAAKKLLQQARPKLTSVLPASAIARGEILIYGTDLIVAASAAPGGAALVPAVTVGGRNAQVTAHEHILGADRLTVSIGNDPSPGAGTISVVRADGVAAVGPAGADGIAFTVLA